MKSFQSFLLVPLMSLVCYSSGDDNNVLKMSVERRLPQLFNHLGVNEWSHLRRPAQQSEYDDETWMDLFNRKPFQDDLNIPAKAKQLGLTTLVDLVTKAGLAATLSGPGPFTVFGPTNKAFEDLPAWVKHKVDNTTFLASVLKFHVLSSLVKSSDLSDNLIVNTVADKSLRINIYKDTVYTAQCVPIDTKQVDQGASNGIIHVLNGVMLPPRGNIVEALSACPAFKTLVKAVGVAKLVDTLSGEGPFTLFAPTDKAFAKLPAGALDKLLANPTLLAELLKYHVVAGTFCSAGLESGPVTTVNGTDVNIVVSPDGSVKVNDAKVIVADGSVTNGVVHAIDTVLLPA